MSAVASFSDRRSIECAACPGDPNLLTTAIRKAIHGLDGNLPLYDARTMVEHMNLPLYPARVAATALGGFGALALLLAAVGVTALLTATAFLACYLPARRATKADPMVVLRQE